MAFSDQFLEELRNRATIVDIVGRRVKLAKKGKEHIGLCPFHKEKTPSFTVNEAKGFYHCFGCGEHGSVFDFIMNTEGLSFPETVEKLATENGMEVIQDSPKERERLKKNQTLFEVNVKAALFFKNQLFSPKGKQALDYLKNRGYLNKTIDQFGLGFAPDDRNALKESLKKEGFNESTLISAGLIIQPDDNTKNTYDRFRRRIMFPISNPNGQVIAFGGRILGEGEPKYLNSPETPLFNKRRVLYGQKLASGSARKSGFIIVTEGYTDVIALHQAGLANTVAPLGTALTEEQIKNLWKIVPEPILCFDGDMAGKKAAARAAERALPLILSGYGLRFALLPDGEDPDSLIKFCGNEAFEQIIQNALPLSEVIWLIESGGRLPESPEQRAALQKRLKDHSLKISDPTLRSHFLSLFNDRLWKEPRYKGRGKRAKSTPWSASMSPVDQTMNNDHLKTGSEALRLAQKVLLAIIINHPGIFEVSGETLGNFSFAEKHLDQLRQELISVLLKNPNLNSSGLKVILKQHGFSEVLDSLFRDSLIKSNRIIRTDAPAEKYQLLWEENVDLLKKLETEFELEKIRNSGEVSISEEDEDVWEQQRALLEETIPGCRD